MNLNSTIRSMGKGISLWFKQKVLRRHEENEGDYAGKVLSEASSFGIMEAYRGIRTNLMYTGTMAKSSVIAVTSAMPNEGKSLTCTNLAVSFAMAGKRVLVIDGDMRNPSQAKIFGVEMDGDGLSEVLSGQRTEPSMIPLEREKGLYLLRTGHRPPNSTELLLGGRMDSLLSRLREEYDVIFIDLPPIGIVTDGVVLAEKVDGYLLVVEAACSDSTNVSRAVDSLEKVNAKILGFVLNNVSQKGGKHGHYSHYRRYGYGAYGDTPESAAAPASAPNAKSARENDVGKKGAAPIQKSAKKKK